MRISRGPTLFLLLISLSLPACNTQREKRRDDAPKITVTAVESKPVTLTRQYLGQIHSHHYIRVRTPEAGYLTAIQVREGQAVKQDDLLFRIGPPSDKEKLDPKYEEKVVSIKAPFEGMVDRLRHQEGSFVQKGETLTTLADNSLMWVYFNVPEARYLEFKLANLDQNPDDLKIELVLASGKKFDQPGKLGAIGAHFNAENGNIAFRADFPNPDGLLRHGQTGTILISHAQGDAIVIPQRATFEVLAKRYVYVVGKDEVAHQREIVVQDEMDDLFVVKSGLEVGEKIITEGIRLVQDGGKVEYGDRQSKKVVAN